MFGVILKSAEEDMTIVPEHFFFSNYFYLLNKQLFKCLHLMDNDNIVTIPVQVWEWRIKEYG